MTEQRESSGEGAPWSAWEVQEAPQSYPECSSSRLTIWPDRVATTVLLSRCQIRHCCSPEWSGEACSLQHRGAIRQTSFNRQVTDVMPKRKTQGRLLSSDRMLICFLKRSSAEFNVAGGDYIVSGPHP